MALVKIICSAAVCTLVPLLSFEPSRSAKCSGVLAATTRVRKVMAPHQSSGR